MVEFLVCLVGSGCIHGVKYLTCSDGSNYVEIL